MLRAGSLIFKTSNSGGLFQSMGINSSGTVTINSLVGTGTRMVTADASGNLSSQTIPASTNIYNTDGTLTGNRTITQAGFSTNFIGGDLTVTPSGANQLLINNDRGNPRLFSSDTLVLQSGGNANQLNLLPNGNVGIGTNAPAAKLDVAGGINLSGALTGTGSSTSSFNNSTGSALTLTNSSAAGLNNVLSLVSTYANANVGPYMSYKLSDGTELGSIGGMLDAAGGSLIFKTSNSGGLFQSMGINSSGTVTINSLVGTGTRMVTADASGNLSSQTIPASTNIYNTDGTLTAARTVTQGANALTFNGTGGVNLNSGKVSIGTSTPNSDAAIDVTSSNKGFLLPRIALVATDNPAPLSAHVGGMMVYNTANSGSGATAVTPGLYVNDGTQWASFIQPNTKYTFSTTLHSNGGTTSTAYKNTLAIPLTAPNAITGNTNATSSSLIVNGNFIAPVSGSYLFTITNYSWNGQGAYLLFLGQSIYGPVETPSIIYLVKGQSVGASIFNSVNGGTSSNLSTIDVLITLK